MKQKHINQCFTYEEHINNMRCGKYREYESNYSLNEYVEERYIYRCTVDGKHIVSYNYYINGIVDYTITLELTTKDIIKLLNAEEQVYMNGQPLVEYLKSKE